jgi:hypothetical protein
VPALAEVATAHARDRLGMVETLADEASRAWRLVNPSRIAESWAARMLPLLVTLTGAQRVVAGEADRYLDNALDAQGLDPAAAARTAPRAVSGVASDGRTLDGLLYRPAVTTLDLIGGGTGVRESLAAGSYLLDMIVRTQVADAGRAADLVATTARRQATGYVRMLVGKSCSRCVVLAGRWYRYDAGFNRHPKCDCVGVPGRENTAGDERTDPRSYFNSLSRDEQDKAFTKAGAEAIRNGSDVAKVVNARRGMQTASIGGRNVLVTTEAAGRRPRLMPEAILAASGGDRDQAIRLLKVHGFIL